MNTNKCLVYPTLQKFYNSLSFLVNINPDNYIFENIPKIDAFLQEFRNITFTMQKHFNTPELKQFYEAKKNKYLVIDGMRWFIDMRNKVTKEHPFKLEKAISLKIYTANNGFDEFKTVLTIDNDKNLTELLDEVKEILKEFYKNNFEVFFSIFIFFIENGKQIDIFNQIIFGIKTMWKFISEVLKTYPCKCKKCKILINKIICDIDKIQIKYQMLFLQDCYYYKGKIQTASRICGHPKGNDIYDKDMHRFNLATNPLFCEEACKNDIILLMEWAAHHVVMLEYLRENSNKEPELLANYCLVYEDNTAELTELFGGTIKTTYYRMANEIADRVRNENIRAALFICETNIYPLENYKEIFSKPAYERQEKAQGTVLNILIVSKKLNKMMGIEIDYSKLDNREYLVKQIKTPKEMPDNFLIYPIFKAMKNK